MFDPGTGLQIHDMQPGIRPNGLFWTDTVPAGNVDVDLAAGTAAMEVDAMHVKDHFDLENALIGGGPKPRPAVVSFNIVWTAEGEVQSFDNVAQQYRGELRAASAQMEWTARTPDYEFVSAPLSTSTSAAALLGSESNGVFY